MNLQDKKSPSAVSSAMKDHTIRRMYTKRALGDINIYAMKDNFTTQELSKIEKRRLANRLSYQRNRDKRIKACMNTYRKKREQLLPQRKEYNKKYYLCNKKQILLDTRAYYINNQEQAKHANKIWYSNNKEKIKPKARLYYNKNREYILSYNKKQIKHKLKTNPTYKLECRLRNRMYHVFKHLGFKKSKRTKQLLGCSVEEARLHIEKQWLPGMSWENYNLYTWHIDHIKPINTFDLSDLKQQEQCFHYTNLRPLWAKDNWARPKDGSDI